MVMADIALHAPELIELFIKHFNNRPAIVQDAFQARFVWYATSQRWNLRRSHCSCFEIFHYHINIEDTRVITVDSGVGFRASVVM